MPAVERRVSILVEKESRKGRPLATQQFDQERAEAFADRMVGVLNEGAIALMTSIGHRTGLFDTLDGCRPPPAPK